MSRCLSYVVFAVVDGVINLFIYYSLQHICMIYDAEPPSLFGNCVRVTDSWVVFVFSSTRLPHACDLTRANHRSVPFPRTWRTVHRRA